MKMNLDEQVCYDNGYHAGRSDCEAEYLHEIQSLLDTIKELRFENELLKRGVTLESFEAIRKNYNA